MKKRTILPLYISSIIGGIILILSITALVLDKTKNYYPFLLLILCRIFVCDIWQRINRQYHGKL